MKEQSPDIRTVTIAALGFGGDGIAHDGDETVFVPYGLPGDVVRVRVTEKKPHQTWAKIIDVMTPSPDRITPPCVHYFACGGCALQHMRDGAYQDWKVQSVMDRLQKANLMPQNPARIVRVQAKSRRRATFCAWRDKGKVIVGFNRHHSDQVIDLQECHVVIDPIMAVVPGLRTLMDALLVDVRQADVSVTLLDTGLDVLMTADITFNLLMHEALAEFVAGHNIARISIRKNDRAVPEVLLQPAPARLSVGGVALDPAPGSFLQPSTDGEAALIDAVLAGVGSAQKVADLFSGLGTFTFPLARACQAVHAVDVDGPGVRAMGIAAGRKSNITYVSRNLYRDPVTARELGAYDAVVFDPPRAGAKGQAVEIVQSGVPRVVAVSCNPATFVTDCAPLVAQGYRFEALTIVDQFTWSAHVELVGVFTRG